MDINQWISKRDVRYYLNTPSIYKGKTVASNGHIVLFAPLSDHKPLFEKLEAGIDKVMLAIDNAHFEPLPAITFPGAIVCEACKGTGKAEVTDCKECEGEGELEFHSDYNIYAVECASCDGKGYESKPSHNTMCEACNGIQKYYPLDKTIELGSVKFSPSYVHLIASIPDLQYAISDLPALLFKTGEYSGAIMGHSK
jgi:hypothetical protein